MLIFKGVEPNVVTYSTLIKGLCKHNDIAKTETVVQRMIAKGFEPDLVTYSHLVVGMCKKCYIEEAKN